MFVIDTCSIPLFLLLYVRYRHLQYSTVSIALCSLSTHAVFHCFYCSMFVIDTCFMFVQYSTVSIAMFVIDTCSIPLFLLLYVRYRHMQFLLLYVRYRHMQYSTVSIVLCSLSTHAVFHCFYCFSLSTHAVFHCFYSSMFVIDTCIIPLFLLLYVRYRHMQYSTVSIVLCSLSTHAVFHCFYSSMFVIDTCSIPLFL